MNIRVSISAFVIDENGYMANSDNPELEAPEGWSVFVDDGKDSIFNRYFDEFENALACAKKLSARYSVELDFRY